MAMSVTSKFTGTIPNKLFRAFTIRRQTMNTNGAKIETILAKFIAEGNHYGHGWLFEIRVFGKELADI